MSEGVTFENLLSKIHNKTMKIVVLGAGYVGLPTASLLADAGFSVTALDLDQNKVNSINDGKSPISEPGLSDLVLRNVQNHRLKATTNSVNALKSADVIVLCVQTPITENKAPDYSYLNSALKEVILAIHSGVIIIIGSTISPGTITNTILPMIESTTGYINENDYYLAYAPERIAPGKAIKEFIENTKLVGGVGPKSTKLVANLFRKICINVIETDVKSAEVSKLAENTFRDINIAYANQLALMCEKLGVDVFEVIKLANTHKRVNIHTPGPGVGGPCLPKDPYLLLHPIDKIQFDIISLSRIINDKMPFHIVDVAKTLFISHRKSISESKIAILGTAYKADVDDSRLSPSKIIIEELMKLGANINVYDPYCSESFGANKVNDLNEAVANSDCILITTNHNIFYELKLEKLKKMMNNNPLLIDCKRIIDPDKARLSGFSYYGVGYYNPS